MIENPWLLVVVPLVLPLLVWIGGYLLVILVFLSIVVVRFLSTDFVPQPMKDTAKGWFNKMKEKRPRLK